MKIVAIGRNYINHAKELNNPIPEEPVVFLKPDTAALKDNKDFYYPEFSKDIHYEVEVILRICNEGKHVSEKFAHKYYDAIGLGIDFTARDVQHHCKDKGLPWELAKAFDHSAVVSPLIPKEEFADVNNLAFSLQKNGKTVQSGNTRDVIFTFDRLIAFISQRITLRKGDLIFTGTPEGVGPVQIGDKLVGYLQEKKCLPVTSNKYVEKDRFLLFALAFSVTTMAQNKDIITNREYPQGYFRNPLNITPDASGTFGELRATHFHAGDDYRTQQRIGLSLYAVAEGYVSRVRVQIGGGGNSVYIDHPNGFTSVYLHMENFNDVLTNIVRDEQYKQQRFDVDITLEKNAVPLTKGQVIGNAGNTGASGGPHLHFEIRETKTQHPLNPQLFGLHFNDKFPPTIQGIMVYDLKDDIFNEHTPRRPLQVKAISGARYTLSTTSPIQVNGKFGLGINTIDRHRAGGFSNGVYSIELFVDGKSISTVLFEELDFNTSRGIHAYIDYPHWKKTQTKFQKSFKDPGNPTEIFHHLENQGIIELNDNNIHDIKYVVKDVHGNCSELNFKIQNSPNYTVKNNTPQGELMKYNQVNTFSRDDIRLEIPEGTLYADLDFVYSKGTQANNGYSTIHHVHNPLIPLFTAYNLRIKPTNLPPHLQSKAVIASTQSGSEGGKFEDGWVTVNTRNFGSFYVAVDTIAPTITARNLTNGKNVANQAKIDFTISDNFSGIQSFHGYIDDEWVLMEYDPKNRHLWHRFSPSLSKGKHTFRLVVKDWKDNENIYEASFIK